MSNHLHEEMTPSHSHSVDDAGGSGVMPVIIIRKARRKNESGYDDDGERERESNREKEKENRTTYN
jgi:hypothetical protein